MTASRIIRRRRYSIEVKNDYLHLLIRIILIGIMGYILLSRIFILTQAHGNHMFPAVKDGDLVVAYRLQREYEQEDVVVYSVDGEERIGRIIGMQSDVIMMDDTGSYSVNGTTQSGEILFPTYAKDGITYPYIVPEDSVYILSDYRTIGTDSRDDGAIPMDDVKGKVITILRRRGL